MIKSFLLILIMISSCASVDYSYFSDIKNIISRNEILVDQSFIDQQEFSFIKISNSKNDAIFVLASIDKFGVYEWVGSNFERIKTKDGLIVETQGLESDIRFYSYNHSILKGVTHFNTYIDLYNPDLIYEEIILKRELTNHFIDDDGIKNTLIKLTKASHGIGWKVKEEYLYKNGLIFNAIQHINPNMEPLDITFYYKF